MAVDLSGMTRKELEKLKSDVEKALEKAAARDLRAAKKAAEKAAAECGYSLGDIAGDIAIRKTQIKRGPAKAGSPIGSGLHCPKGQILQKWKSRSHLIAPLAQIADNICKTREESFP